MSGGFENAKMDVDGRYVSWEPQTNSSEEDSSNNVSKPSDQSRWREIRNVGIGLTLTALSLSGAYEYIDNDSQPRRSEPVVTTSSHSLQGHHFDGLRARYIGESGLVVGEFESDFKDQLDASWRRKRRVASNKSAVDHVVENQVEAYDPSTSQKMSLDQYLESLEDDFDGAWRSTDWETFQRDQGLTEQETIAVRSALGNVSDKTLGAYAMTELFPQPRQGDRDVAARKNKAVFDYMVRHGGTDYVELQPALFDSYLSFGPFQLTSYVVREDDDVTASANRINEAMHSSDRVPASMKYVDGEDHVNAAYGLLATQLSRLVDDDGDEVEEALRDATDREMSLVAAGLHHRPGVARHDLQEWAETEESLSPSHLGGVEEYARQTAVNYDVLSSEKPLRPRNLHDYFEPVRETSEWTYFKVQGRPQTQHPRTVAYTFDVLDKVGEDTYENTGNLNVVGRDGSLYDGGAMYFKAEPKQ